MYLNLTGSATDGNATRSPYPFTPPLQEEPLSHSTEPYLTACYSNSVVQHAGRKRHALSLYMWLLPRHQSHTIIYKLVRRLIYRIHNASSHVLRDNNKRADHPHSTKQWGEELKQCKPFNHISIIILYTAIPVSLRSHCVTGRPIGDNPASLSVIRHTATDRHTATNCTKGHKHRLFGRKSSLSHDIEYDRNKTQRISTSLMPRIVPRFAFPHYS